MSELPEGVDFVGYQRYPTSERLPRLRVLAGSIRYVPIQGYRYYADLQGTFEDYLTTFSNKTRRTLQREIRKFSAMGGGRLDCRVYSTVDQMQEYHRLARGIAVKTYQENLFRGGIPDSKEFAEEMCRLAMEDRVRGLILFSEGRPIAYLYLPVEDDRIVQYSYSGYDPGYSNWSPGTVLMYLALERLFSERKFRYIDNGFGGGWMKVIFSTGKFLGADIYYFRKKPANYLALYGHVGMNSFSAFCGRSLDTLGLRRAVRKFLRSM